MAAEALAKSLLTLSLSRQPLLTAQNFTHPLLYLCGEWDKKFTANAMKSGFTFKVLEKARHNIHFEQIDAFVQMVLRWLNKQEKRKWQKQ